MTDNTTIKSCQHTSAMTQLHLHRSQQVSAMKQNYQCIGINRRQENVLEQSAKNIKGSPKPH